MQWKGSLALAAALMFGLSGAAQAEMGEGGHEAEQLQKYDTNGDGVVSLEEAKAAEDQTLAEKFDFYDEDDNQELDEGEFAQFEAEQGQMEEKGGTESKEKMLNE